MIKERTKETSPNISLPCIPSTTIAGAGQHLFNTCLRCTSYRGCWPSHQIPIQWWASIAAHCWFNAGQSSKTLVQHNADVMQGHRLRRWANIIPTKTL